METGVIVIFGVLGLGVVFLIFLKFYTAKRSKEGWGKK